MGDLFSRLFRGASFQPRTFRSREGNLLATRFLQYIRMNLGLDKVSDVSTNRRHSMRS